MKPRYKRRIFWTSVSVLAAAALAVVIVPPFVSLNYLKPKIESAISQQTGMVAKIDGNINFSLMGGAKIVAHGVVLPKGIMDHVLFSIPTSKIFNLESAPLTGNIFVYGAQFSVNELTPPTVTNNIDFADSVIRFKGKDYKIIHGRLSNGLLAGTVQTDQYRYEFDSNGDEFHIKNKDNNLDISGNLYSDGTAHGALSIETNNINKWFEFDEPKIPGRVKLRMDFDWNGNYGFKFSNIVGDNFTGDIELFDDGRREITLSATGVNFDLSFLMNKTGVFYNTSFNLDLYGNLKFADKIFQHIKVDATGTKSDIQIRNIVADNIVINGGLVTENGAVNLPISLQIDGVNTYCMFSGTPNAWQCSEFRHGNLFGSLSVINNEFEVFIQSNGRMPDEPDFSAKTKLLGNRGVVNFQFSDIGGSVKIDKTKIVPSYQFAKNKNLDWLEMDLYFLPESFRSAIGDFSWNENGLTFIPHSNRWQIVMGNSNFNLTGKNIKDLFKNIDLQSINDLEYAISGNFKNKNISNLKIEIAGHVFRGTAIGNNITLATDLLNLDSFTNQNFIDNYDELQFLTIDPLMIPFMTNLNVSLSANTLIYNGNDFTNFVYSLKSDAQTFSITDSKRGNLLVNITKAQNKYNAVVQLNKFVIYDKLLSQNMPINITNTTITGDMILSTQGQIAYDIWYNLAGQIDLTFDGGDIIGLGIDDFYANARNLTKLNAEFALANALDGGTSNLKSLHIIGEYNGGNFVSTHPFTLSLRHSDATGNVQVEDGNMIVAMNLVLRGTSPLPVPIAMEMMPNGGRNYSLSQIMINFDPDFMRDFVITHNKF